MGVDILTKTLINNVWQLSINIESFAKIQRIVRPNSQMVQSVPIFVS